MSVDKIGYSARIWPAVDQTSAPPPSRLSFDRRGLASLDQVDRSRRIISTRGHCRVATARNRLVGGDPALGSARTAPTSKLLPGRFRRSRQQSYNFVPGVSRFPARSRFQLSVRAAGDIREHGLVPRRPSDPRRLPARLCHMPGGRGLRDRKNRKGAGVQTASTDFPVRGVSAAQ